MSKDNPKLVRYEPNKKRYPWFEVKQQENGDYVLYDQAERIITAEREKSAKLAKELKEENDSLRTALMKDKEFIEELASRLDEYKKLLTTKYQIKVKQLKWLEVTRNAFRAETVFGTYVINSHIGGEFYWALPGVLTRRTQSVDEAKAAAQEDFERRIRWSLEE